MTVRRKNSRQPSTIHTLAHATLIEHRNSVFESINDINSIQNLSIKKKQSKIERYCWKVCFTICMLVLFRFCAILVIKYCTYGTHLSMENKLTPNLTFPAVTICNNGKYFNTTHMNRDDILRSWAIDEAFTVNDYEETPDSEKREYQETFRKVWEGDGMVANDTGHFVVAGYPIKFYNKTFTKFMDVWGYNLTDSLELDRGITLIHGKFGAKKIRAWKKLPDPVPRHLRSYKDIPFRRIYTELGVCYTWNMYSKQRNQEQKK